MEVAGPARGPDAATCGSLGLASGRAMRGGDGMESSLKEAMMLPVTAALQKRKTDGEVRTSIIDEVVTESQSRRAGTPRPPAADALPGSRAGGSSSDASAALPDWARLPNLIHDSLVVYAVLLREAEVGRLHSCTLQCYRTHPSLCSW